MVTPGLSLSRGCSTATATCTGTSTGQPNVSNQLQIHQRQSHLHHQNQNPRSLFGNFWPWNYCQSENLGNPENPGNRNHRNHNRSRMVKTSLVLLVSFLLLLTIMASYGEPEPGPQEGEGDGEETTQSTRTRVRSKLSAARRKKNPSKTTTTTTTLPSTSLEDDIDETDQMNLDGTMTMTNTMSLSSSPPVTNGHGYGNGNSEFEDPATVATTTTTRPPKRKVSPRQSQGNPPSPSSPRTGPVPQGCAECDQDECTNTPSESSCPTGLVLDRCGCCYICGALEGNRCYNASLNLPYNPEVGVCGPHLDCLLRNDLDPNEPREALCECRDKRIVCGSDRQTYLSECKLREAAHSKQGLIVGAWSPCVSAPVMTTPVENTTVPIGEDVSLSCEVRSFPAPVLHWEFKAEGSNSNARPLILPGDDSGIVVVVRGGPEQIMTTSWIQIIAVDPKRQGTYYCMAKNSEGMTQAAAEVRVYKSIDEEEF